MNHRSLSTVVGLALLPLFPVACETPGDVGTPGTVVKSGPDAPDEMPPVEPTPPADMVAAPGPVTAPGTDDGSTLSTGGDVILSLAGTPVHIRPASTFVTPLAPTSSPAAVIEFGQLHLGQDTMNFTITVPAGARFEVADGAGRPESTLQLESGKNEVKLVRETTGVRFEATRPVGIAKTAQATKTSPNNPHVAIPAGAPRVQAEKVGDDSKRLRIWANVGDVRSSFLLIRK